MRAYTKQQLGERIKKFLTKHTQRFPELRDGGRFRRKDTYGSRVINSLEKASALWGRYIHA